MNGLIERVSNLSREVNNILQDLEEYLRKSRVVRLMSEIASNDILFYDVVNIDRALQLTLVDMVKLIDKDRYLVVRNNGDYIRIKDSDIQFKHNLNKTYTYFGFRKYTYLLFDKVLKEDLEFVEGDRDLYQFLLDFVRLSKMVYTSIFRLRNKYYDEDSRFKNAKVVVIEVYKQYSSISLYIGPFRYTLFNRDGLKETIFSYRFEISDFRTITDLKGNRLNDFDIFSYSLKLFFDNEKQIEKKLEQYINNFKGLHNLIHKYQTYMKLKNI